MLEPKRNSKVWRPPGFEGLELNKTSTNLSSQPRHVHEAHQIGLILRGGGTFGYRGVRVNVPAGYLAVVQAGEAHSCYTGEAGGWTFGILYVDPDLLERVSSELTGRASTLYFSALVFDHRGLAKTVLDLFGSFERPAARLERETRLFHTLSEIIKRCADDPPPMRSSGREHRAVRVVKDYLRAHYSDEVTLAELACLTGLSRLYGHRVFTKAEGLTPHDFQMSVRVAEAKTALLRGQPLAAVAAETGFSDQAHFTRTFKKYTGVTPGKYRACL